MKPSSKETMSRLCGFLYPVSEAAKRSFQLLHNKAVVSQLPADETVHLQTPAPSEETVEDYDDLEKAHIRPAGLPVPSHVAILRQSNTTSTFSLGSGLENYLVLQHDPDQNDEHEASYINFIHLKVYPDPDTTDLWLKNMSTSTHQVKERWGDGQVMQMGAHGGSLAVHKGEWDLSLGPGWQLMLKVVAEDLEASLTTPLVSSLPSSKQKQSQRTSSRKSQQGAAAQKLSKAESQETQQEPQFLQLRKSKKKHVNQPVDRLRKGSASAAATEDVSKVAEGISSEIELIGVTRNSRVERRLRNDVVVAVKICRRPEIPDAADMWLQELRILQAIGHHPNISQLVDYDALQRELTLKLIPGQSLEEYRNHDHMSTLTEDQCYQIWQDATAGLVFVHSKDILHNDIKPSNIMHDLTTKSTVLIDFGVASERMIKRFEGAGTPWYLSPEYLVRERSFPSDIWALAVVMLFALGITPLPEKTEESWLIKNLFDRDSGDAPKMRSWLSKVISIKSKVSQSRPTLLKMMDLSPMKRISAASLVSELEASTTQLLRRM